MKHLGLALATFGLIFPMAALAGDPSWSAPSEPYNIYGNVWSVGTQGVCVFLITTPKGHILIDATTEAGAAVVEANVVKLGFKLRDIKYVLESHAHYDHVGGMAKIKRDTGAVFVASAGDRYGLEHGTHVGDNVNGIATFTPVKVDRVIGDGGEVSLGGVILTAHMTPGHTRGDTSWTTTIAGPVQPLHVVFYGSTTTAGNVLVGNKAYPGIVGDYRTSFARLKALKVDLLLGDHPEFFHMDDKRAKQLAGNAKAFIDPTEYPGFVAHSQADFEAELKRQGGH